MEPTPDQLARFREVSPIAHVDKVQAPLLFMLGAKDRRYETLLGITHIAVDMAVFITLSQGCSLRDRVFLSCCWCTMWYISSFSESGVDAIDCIVRQKHARHIRLSFICRVPLVDAQQYARALKARKDAPEVKIWVFEDTHALDKPQTDFEQWMNVAWWLRRHMQ